MASPHRLVIVRHSKAEAYAGTDAERRLSDRGRKDAAAAGAWLATQGSAPDRALVSGALRTRETWELLAKAAGWAVDAEFDDALYGADEDTVLDILRTVDESVGSVVLVGHNPTVGMLAQLLDDGDGDPSAVDSLVLGYPTSAVTVFDVPVPWARLGPGSATLRGYEVGRG
ncbi:MAG TPA: histidine phosphatase family protein [Nocardioides sp.]|nr:histidine phosphatase family protein [Nocardioides sp.]